MKKAIIMAAIAAALLTVGFASAAGSSNLRAFGTGDVFVNGAKGATFNDSGEYGGFYRSHTSNELLTSTKIDLELVNDRAIGGGAPRFSIPIDESNDKVVEAYAFIDVNSCGSSTVSTESATCQVYYGTEPNPYANWAAFASAHATWRLARKEQVGTKPNGKPDYDGTMPFIIAARRAITSFTESF